MVLFLIGLVLFALGTAGDGWETVGYFSTSICLPCMGFL